jgi:hypothetical protein
MLRQTDKSIDSMATPAKIDTNKVLPATVVFISMMFVINIIANTTPKKSVKNGLRPVMI